VIFYNNTPDQGVTNDYRYISPTGTGDTDYIALPSSNFQGIALNASSATKYFGYFSTATSTFGIYSSTTWSISGATALVAPTYAFVGSLQVSPDGTTLYYTAATSATQDPQLWKVPVAGGTPVALDTAESFHLNAAGTTFVYSKIVNGVPQLFTRGTGVGDTVTQITKNSYANDLPQWNKQGNQIAFCANPAGPQNPYDIYTMNPDGTGVTQITNTPNTDEFTPSYNTGGTLVSYSTQDTDVTKQGLYTIALTGSATATLIKADQTIQPGTYWTTTGGRGGGSWNFVMRTKRKTDKAHKLPKT